MYSTASLTLVIFSASSSGISSSKASSNAMTSSTMSRESAPRSSTNDALASTWLSSTPSCSTIICFTFCSTAAMIPPGIMCERDDFSDLHERSATMFRGAHEDCPIRTSPKLPFCHGIGPFRLPPALTLVLGGHRVHRETGIHGWQALPQQQRAGGRTGGVEELQPDLTHLAGDAGGQGGIGRVWPARIGRG